MTACLLPSVDVACVLAVLCMCTFVAMAGVPLFPSENLLQWQDYIPGLVNSHFAVEHIIPYGADGLLVAGNGCIFEYLNATTGECVWNYPYQSNCFLGESVQFMELRGQKVLIVTTSSVTLLDLQQRRSSVHGDYDLTITRFFSHPDQDPNTLYGYDDLNVYQFTLLPRVQFVKIYSVRRSPIMSATVLSVQPWKVLLSYGRRGFVTIDAAGKVLDEAPEAAFDIAPVLSLRKGVLFAAKCNQTTVTVCTWNVTQLYSNPLCLDIAGAFKISGMELVPAPKEALVLWLSSSASQESYLAAIDVDRNVALLPPTGVNSRQAHALYVGGTDCAYLVDEMAGTIVQWQQSTNRIRSAAVRVVGGGADRARAFLDFRGVIYVAMNYTIVSVRVSTMEPLTVAPTRRKPMTITSTPAIGMDRQPGQVIVGDEGGYVASLLSLRFVKERATTILPDSRTSRILTNVVHTADSIFLGIDNTIRRYSVSGGELLWRSELLYAASGGTLGVFGPVVVYVSAVIHQGLIVLDAKSGAILRKFSVSLSSGVTNFYWDSQEGCVYIACGSSRVMRLTSKLELQTSQAVSGSVQYVVMDTNALYFTDSEGSAIRLVKTLFTSNFSQSPNYVVKNALSAAASSQSVLLDDGTWYVPTGRDTVNVLKAATGERVLRRMVYGSPLSDMWTLAGFAMVSTSDGLLEIFGDQQTNYSWSNQSITYKKTNANVPALSGAFMLFAHTKGLTFGKMNPANSSVNVMWSVYLTEWDGCGKPQIVNGVAVAVCSQDLRAYRASDGVPLYRTGASALERSSTTYVDDKPQALLSAWNTIMITQVDLPPPQT